MRELKYPFVLYPAAEGGYVAEVPALEGCLAQGDTLLETLEELENVESLWPETALNAGLPLPKVDIEIERVKQKLAA